MFNTIIILLVFLCRFRQSLDALKMDFIAPVGEEEMRVIKNCTSCKKSFRAHMVRRQKKKKTEKKNNLQHYL